MQDGAARALDQEHRRTRTVVRVEERQNNLLILDPRALCSASAAAAGDARRRARTRENEARRRVEREREEDVLPRLGRLEVRVRPLLPPELAR